MQYVDYKVHYKENIYFYIRLLMSIIMYVLIIFGFYAAITSGFNQMWILAFYGVAIGGYIFFATGIMVGYIQGNGIKVTERQFPEVYAIIKDQCRKLDMDVPPVYLMQNGGALNAFATKFIGRNYVVIYSEIFDLAFEEGVDELSFVIAHELGHIKRNHISKNLWLLPSIFIPFLGSAYSRACEYTCDNIGHALSPEGSIDGLLILASGKKSYKKVNLIEYFRSTGQETGFWKWFAERLSSHPNLPKRLINIKYANSPKPVATENANQLASV